MSLLSADLDNIGSFFSDMKGRCQTDDTTPRKLIQRRGPVLAFNGNENAPDDYEIDSTLILPERPADFPTEEDWSREVEDLPFSDPLDDDDEQ